jgi:excisionase family DNA binding protein
MTHPQRRQRTPSCRNWWRKGNVRMNTCSIEVELVVYTVPEVAGILKISEKSVYRLIERNHLKSCCALRHKRVSKMELSRFIQATSGLFQ